MHALPLSAQLWPKPWRTMGEHLPYFYRVAKQFSWGAVFKLAQIIFLWIWVWYTLYLWSLADDAIVCAAPLTT